MNPFIFFAAVGVLMEFCTSKELECYSKNSNGISPVNCSAVLHQLENCTDAFLSQSYEDLYNQTYWPEKPHDLMLMPISEVYNNQFLLPGFSIINTPPRTGSIRLVKGFHVDFLENRDTSKKKCIIIQITNRTLNYQDRDNNLTFHVKLIPLNGPSDFQFISWSLPKPPENEKGSSQKRDGRTGVYGWALTKAPADWLTTISYYNNLQGAYIRFWFVLAPAKFGFLEYNVRLEQILAMENTTQEHRAITEENIISKTDYTFLNAKPGRYRILVQPNDDKFNSLDCRCKMNHGGCGTCAVTKTAVIVVPEPEKTPPSTKVPLEQNKDYVLPSVLGSVSFVLIVVIVIGCYKLRQISEYGLIFPEPATTDTHLQTTTVPTEAMYEARMYHEKDRTAIILVADENVKRNKLEGTLSSLLEAAYYLKVVDSSHTSPYVNEWIKNAVDHANLVVMVVSSTAIDQYNHWVDSGYGETDLFFLESLKKILDKAVEIPDFGDRIIVINFPHTIELKIPNDLTNKPMFVLPGQFQDFLGFISSEPFNIKTKPHIMHNIGETDVGKNFLRALDDCSRRKERVPSDDSGYTDLNFLPPSPSLSRGSQVNSQHLYDQIEQINFPNGV